MSSAEDASFEEMVESLDDMFDDDELSLRMHQSMEGIRADPQQLVAAAILTGRTRIRRRRITAGVATAMAALGGAYAFGVASEIGQDRGPQIVAIPSFTTTASPTPSAKPSKAPDHAARTRQLPARVAGLYLTRLAPTGDFGKFYGQQSSDTVYVETTLDRGAGPVGLKVNVQAHFLGSGLDPDGDDKATKTNVQEFYSCANAAFKECEISKTDGGGTIRISTELAGEATIVVADQLRADGTRVVVRTGNSEDTKYGGTTRKGVTTREAQTIATSVLWDLYATPSDTDVRAAKRKITAWTLG